MRAEGDTQDGHGYAAGMVALHVAFKRLTVALADMEMGSWQYIAVAMAMEGRREGDQTPCNHP